jgi:thiamine monophosphate synthase
LALVIDRTLLTPQWTLGQAVAPAVTGGANLVILRETDLPRKPRLEVARFVLDGIRGRAPLLVSDEPEMSLEAGAHGVFIEDPARAVEARNLLGNDRLVGVLIAAPETLRYAEEARADFGLLNLDWSGPESAFSMISKYTQATRIPLIAGIDLPADSVEGCLSRGAAGIAICRPGMAAYNRTQAVEEYARALQNI